MNSIPQELQWKTLFSGDPLDGWLHSGIAVMRDGSVVFEAPGGGAFIRLNPDHPESNDAEYKKVKVPAAVLHGITSVGAQDEIWICDPGVYLGPPAGQVIRVNSHGDVLGKLQRPGSQAGAPPTWKPTSLAVVEVDGSQKGDIWIADGYGESLVHRIRPDGITQTLDGISSGVAFDCPHGVAIDTRGELALVVIADRGNERIVFFTLEGDYVRTMRSPKLVGPSSIAVRGDRLFITDLFGAIVSIDTNDEVEIHVSAAHSDRGEGWPNRMKDGVEVAPAVVDGAVNSPHGIAVSDDGRVLFTEWYLGGRVVQIF